MRQWFCPALLFNPGSALGLYLAVNGRCVPAARAYKNKQTEIFEETEETPE